LVRRRLRGKRGGSAGRGGQARRTRIRRKTGRTGEEARQVRRMCKHRGHVGLTGILSTLTRQMAEAVNTKVKRAVILKKVYEKLREENTGRSKSLTVWGGGEGFIFKPRNPRGKLKELLNGELGRGRNLHNVREVSCTNPTRRKPVRGPGISPRKEGDRIHEQGSENSVERKGNGTAVLEASKSRPIERWMGRGMSEKDLLRRKKDM